MKEKSYKEKEIYKNNNKKDDCFEETWDTDWWKRDYRTPLDIQMEQIEKMTQEYFEAQLALKPSLTPGAMQLNWKIPSIFPLCPQSPSNKPLDNYLANLKKGTLFCHNHVYKSIVIQAELSLDGQHIAVLSATSPDSVKDYALAEIYFQNGVYIHKNNRSFFTEAGAEKYYTISTGKEWTGGETMDDGC